MDLQASILQTNNFNQFKQMVNGLLLFHIANSQCILLGKLLGKLLSQVLATLSSRTSQLMGRCKVLIPINRQATQTTITSMLHQV